MQNDLSMTEHSSDQLQRVLNSLGLVRKVLKQLSCYMYKLLEQFSKLVSFCKISCLYW